MTVAAEGISAQPLGIVAAGGRVPIMVAEAAARAGRPVFVVALRGLAVPEVARFSHIVVPIGMPGRVFSAFRGAGCREIVIVGSATRPRIRDIRLDFKALRLITRYARALLGGDDKLLTWLVRLFEAEGFTVRGAHEIAPELLAGEGPLGRCAPSPADAADIAIGIDYLATAGRFDIGQAVVVANHRIVAIEAAEGTDLMLARVAELRAMGRLRLSGRAGVLVKTPKPDQDRRVDLPAIGASTVAGALRAELRGIAVAAGETLVADAAETVAAADRAGLFVAGIPLRGPSS
ncbi:LpxI family protein [Blastochloris sulfoviridis]|uniref:LpxI family protein n=1 Tax=Blastochloris sulfoviridis TaxID=50712 RepID=UPI001FEA31CB|nr:UDP-2,3-diacylglucosamine diphosphatase LpxI [Blastochloris sulfoviridis]